MFCSVCSLGTFLHASIWCAAFFHPDKSSDTAKKVETTAYFLRGCWCILNEKIFPRFFCTGSTPPAGNLLFCCAQRCDSSMISQSAGTDCALPCTYWKGWYFTWSAYSLICVWVVYDVVFVLSSSTIDALWHSCMQHLLPPFFYDLVESLLYDDKTRPFGWRTLYLVVLFFYLID